jgi:FHS family L-fucose permease-like MFS transporter
LSFLETSANPYIVAMGPAETGTQRLNLAQSFNPVGSITGVLLSKLFILSQLNSANAIERAQMSEEQLQSIQNAELSAVMGPYVGVAGALVILWILIKVTTMPAASDEDSSINFGSSFKRLLRNKNYVWAVIAQFFYVGAQIGVWSFTIRFVMQELDLNEEQASSYYLAALILFLISRFISTWLMKFVKPTTLLTLLSLLAMVFAATVILANGYVAVYALVGISACMSLMFPTIYALGLAGLGEDTKIGGSGLVMAILGGAVITGIQGQVSDITGSIHIAYIVPLLCFGVVAYYGFIANKLLNR